MIIFVSYKNNDYFLNHHRELVYFFLISLRFAQAEVVNMRLPARYGREHEMKSELTAKLKEKSAELATELKCQLSSTPTRWLHFKQLTMTKHERWARHTRR